MGIKMFQCLPATLGLKTKIQQVAQSFLSKKGKELSGKIMLRDIVVRSSKKLF